MLICPLGVVHDVLGRGVPVIFKVPLLLVTVADKLAVHPLFPVTVTVYMPAVKVVISSVTALLDHSKLFPVVPETERLTAPLFCPHVAGVEVELNIGLTIFWPTEKEAVALQLAPSLTVTV